MILNIELTDLRLQFDILNTPLADLWLERMSIRDQWTLDDTKRFYGFGSQGEEERIALEKINHCITLIKLKHTNIAVGYLEDVRDQDRLNYWHHVFETYHGLLGQEDQNDTLTPVLSDLNLAIHRCEAVARGNRPRFVCTWYGMPKTQSLPVELMKDYGTLNPQFGSVCINYAEIGKTLEDLTQDNDNYIGDDAFKPFNHYSADFTVRLHEETVAYSAEKLIRVQAYYNHHRDFFFEHGYTTFQDPRMLPLRFPVAQLIETMPREQLLAEIQQRQCITKVYIE